MNGASDGVLRRLLRALGLPPAPDLEAAVEVSYATGHPGRPRDGTRVTIDLGVR